MRIESRKQELQTMVATRFRAVLKSAEYGPPALAVEDVVADLLSRMDWSADSDDFPSTAEVDRAVSSYVRMAVDRYVESLMDGQQRFMLAEAIGLRDQTVEVVTAMDHGLRPGTRGIVKGFGVSTQTEAGVLQLGEPVIIVEFCVKEPEHQHVDVTFSKVEFKGVLRVLGPQA